MGILSSCMILLLFLSCTGSTVADTMGSSRLELQSANQARVTASSTFTGPDAARLRQVIDANGDLDGTITTDEVESYQDSMRDEIMQNQSSYLIDDIRGTYTLVTVTITGAEGGGGSSDEVTILSLMMLSFTGIDTGKAEHTLVFNNSNDDPGAIAVCVPKGYVITAIEGMADPTGDEQCFEVSGTSLPQYDVVITFQKTSGGIKKDSPGFQLAVVVAAVGLVMLVLASGRRNRW